MIRDTSRGETPRRTKHMPCSLASDRDVILPGQFDIVCTSSYPILLNEVFGYIVTTEKYRGLGLKVINDRDYRFVRCPCPNRVGGRESIGPFAHGVHGRSKNLGPKP